EQVVVEEGGQGPLPAAETEGGDVETALDIDLAVDLPADLLGGGARVGAQGAFETQRGSGHPVELGQDLGGEHGFGVGLGGEGGRRVCGGALEIDPALVVEVAVAVAQPDLADGLL